MLRSESGYPNWDEWWTRGRPHAMTYAEYLKAMERWVSEGVHSGPQESADLVRYTVLNAHRMRRVAKTIRWPESLLRALGQWNAEHHHWVLITESWCGDGAMTGALVAAMAERAGIPFEVMLRDGPVDLVQDFLTRGGRSIPIWILADHSGRVHGFWGPRPGPLQDMVDAHRSAPEPKPAYSEFAEQVQLWYSRDRGLTFFREAEAAFEALEGGRI